MKPSFNLQLFFILFIAFIGMTVVGTLTHELGHYTIAKCLGHEASINYQSTRHWNVSAEKYLSETYAQYKNEINNDKDFPEKKNWETTLAQSDSENFKILLGGPLQTMLTGTIGLLLVWLNRKKYRQPVSVTGWIFIFLALFWLRQVANLFMVLLGWITRGHISLSGDEIRLALRLHLPQWSIQLTTGILGLGILIYIVFKILPVKIRFTFLLAGLLGGCAGYYLWLIRFGPYIMPY